MQEVWSLLTVGFWNGKEAEVFLSSTERGVAQHQILGRLDIFHLCLLNAFLGSDCNGEAQRLVEELLLCQAENDEVKVH